MTIVMNFIIYLLYGVTVIALYRIAYFQFSLILHIWRFISSNYDYAIWREFLAVATTSPDLKNGS